MTLLDGGSKENWAEKLRSRTYWVVYFLIPFLVVLHIASGHSRTWLIVGGVMMALAIWRRPRSE
jgi:hypothetical protein